MSGNFEICHVVISNKSHKCESCFVEFPKGSYMFLEVGYNEFFFYGRYCFACWAGYLHASSFIDGIEFCDIDWSTYSDWNQLTIEEKLIHDNLFVRKAALLELDRRNKVKSK